MTCFHEQVFSHIDHCLVCIYNKKNPKVRCCLDKLNLQLCVDRLMDSKSPALDTVKMQVYFDMNYTTRADFLQEHRRVLESRLQPVIREITDSRARTREELESLYRKIVSAVLLRSGLGSPTDITVVREATGRKVGTFNL